MTETHIIPGPNGNSRLASYEKGAAIVDMAERTGMPISNVPAPDTACPTPITQSVRFEPYLDSIEAAALLNIHPKTLQKYARRGDVPGHRFGDLWRFRASELDEWGRSQLSLSCHSCRN